MAVEQARGCGYRRVGGLYLCGGGSGIACDRLPYKIENCPTCGSGLKFTRAWTWLDWYAYAGEHSENAFIHNVCACMPMCPICHPAIRTPLLAENKKVYGLLWVGEKFYSPEGFVKEALQMGVSRRLPGGNADIPRGPRGLKLGQTWVLFAHKHVIPFKNDKNEDDFKPAIFHAFLPTSLELLIWQKDATPEYLETLKKSGITPIIIPDGDKDHDPSSPVGLDEDEKEGVESKIFFNDLRNRLKR